MANIVFNVETYNKSLIGALYNQNAFIELLNKKFENFQNVQGQKGTVVSYDIPPSVDFIESLGVSSWGSFSQRKFDLSVDQEGTVPLAVPNLERLFNLEQNGYLTVLAKSAIAELGSRIAKNVALNCEDHTYLTFGDGTSSILSFQSLNQAVQDFDDMGMQTGNDMCMIIPTTASAAITANGLSQFAMSRNDELASNWYVASIGAVDVYHSNVLPRHTSGTVGQDDTTLTVISINAAGDQIVLSGAVNDDVNAIKAGDILTFQDGVSPHTDLRYLTYYGQVVSGQQVQVRAENDVIAGGSGQVTVNIFPALNSSGDRDSNINTDVVAGMQAKALNNHTCGLFFSKSAFMLAMPNLGSTSPYEGSSLTDPETGISMRVYNGFLTDTAETGYVHQAAWGSRLTDRYAKRLAFPY